MKRPTIPDLAQAARVSVSTVNRVINTPGKVRKPTLERVLHAAQEIGFYGLGSIEYSMSRTWQTHRLGVLLLSRNRTFYRDLGDAIQRAADALPDANIDLTLVHLDDLSPDNVAQQIVDLGKRCESIAIVSAQHPLVADAVDAVLDSGVPVIGLIGPISARGNVGYVGLDNWKVGRTAAWAFDRLVRDPGKIGILLGNHRYRNQELNESGFRSYFREHNSGFTLLEPMATYESAAVAREHTEEMLRRHPDLCGLFISGGGITGAVAALKAAELRDDFVSVGYELFDDTRTALIDGTLSMVISHPIDRFAQEAVATLIKAKQTGPDSGALRVSLGFDIYTPENL